MGNYAEITIDEGVRLRQEAKEQLEQEGEADERDEADPYRHRHVDGTDLKKVAHIGSEHGEVEADA